MGKKIQQQEPYMIIQTDASTNGWGHSAREFRHGEMVKGGEAFSHKCSRTTDIKFTILTFTKNL